MEKSDAPVEPLPAHIHRWMKEVVAPLADEIMAGKRRVLSRAESEAKFLEAFEKAKEEGSST